VRKLPSPENRNALDTRVTLSADLRNLLDTTYTEVLDAPMPGRTLLVGGQVRF
jgi:iron complex outermembrane receptor protein